MKRMMTMEPELGAAGAVSGDARTGDPVARDEEAVNPLLAPWETPYETPPFGRFRNEDFEPAFEVAMARVRDEVEAIAADPHTPTFENTVVALERRGALLDRIAGVFFNLLNAHTSDELQRIALRVQPRLTALDNDVTLDARLFGRVKQVYENPGPDLSAEDRRLLEKCYRRFVRSGAALAEEEKRRYRSISSELAELSLRFDQNELAATNDFVLRIEDPKRVEELPEFLREAMAAEAKARGETGWVVTLQHPSYVPFLTYSSDRTLKEQIWRAYNSRALGGAADNTQIVKRIARLRLEIARLLGYGCYAEYVLEERMAHDVPTVRAFLGELLDGSREYAAEEYRRLSEYAAGEGFEGPLMPWDWAYFAERYKRLHYEVDAERMKPYFELDRVREGIFLLAGRLYGLHFARRNDIETYHPDVTVYEVADAEGRFMAVLYLDFFPRASKNPGAWMTEFRGASRCGGREVRPLVSLVMNFTKPTETAPSLLTFDEVETFLHEFGHALHAILGVGTYESLTGTNVSRDFVELPSQIMENWAVEREFLDLWAVDYRTGEPMPGELVDRLVAARNYLAAYANMRQLSFGLADLAWHTLEEPYDGDVEEFERRAMAPAQVLPVVEGVAMSPAFGHIFAGGYAAGYYGYKWAEVLEADAFELFRERGVFDPGVAAAFRNEILAKGGSEDPMELYVRFRGHRPGPKALLRKLGLGR